MNRSNVSWGLEACQGEVREWMSLARRGDFAGAWQMSDRMLQRHLRRPERNRPRDQQAVWTGEPLNGKRVLVRCYRGLGGHHSIRPLRADGARDGPRTDRGGRVAW